jgi:hypothetical protein
MTGNNACGQLQTVKNQYLLVILGISISPYPRIFHYTFNEFWPQVSSLFSHRRRQQTSQAETYIFFLDPDPCEPRSLHEILTEKGSRPNQRQLEAAHSPKSRDCESPPHAEYCAFVTTSFSTSSHCWILSLCPNRLPRTLFHVLLASAVCCLRSRIDGPRARQEIRQSDSFMR